MFYYHIHEDREVYGTKGRILHVQLPKYTYTDNSTMMIS